ncbi:hypothetical protein MLD38_002854 [Melastoma candidum]|uniref:Uncharacterized protein n=1 Tax=Melastoma candidum TaxID=119954 RepID=A0ACB9S296_9MYRT|nr:hypothetical protein MLD38_002854 [Melastoma candidum]
MFPPPNNNDPFFIPYSGDSDDPPQQPAYPYYLDLPPDSAPAEFAAGFPFHHEEINAGCSSQREAAEINVDDIDGDRKKKHREIERLRRKEMTVLYSNLRSVVPPEYMKRKRSASDLMNEAKNYIKDMEEKVKELSITRDELKKSSNRDIASGSSGSSSNFIEVGPWSEGVEIIISRHVAPEECLRLSAIIEALGHEGLNVVSWVSNREGYRIIYTIHCEISGTGGHDLTQLKLWLTDLVACCIERHDM